jgi:hypothetical protein
MRGAPQSGFSMLIRRINARSFVSICGRHMFDGIIEANSSSRTAESRLINDPGDADGLQLFTWA